VANFVSVPVFVFALQCEGELLLMLSTLLPQLRLVTDDAFLQPTLLQSCIGCLLALLEAGARSGHLPYSSQVTADSMRSWRLYLCFAYMLSARPTTAAVLTRLHRSFSAQEDFSQTRQSPAPVTKPLLLSAKQITEPLNSSKLPMPVLLH